MYDEAFWVAVAAASPVIALDAIVASGDAGTELAKLGEWHGAHLNVPFEREQSIHK
jgi:hypothetical protein